ncbi:MAG: hypothetical protein U1E42_01535 [Rhodospirillales bacterium]
MSKIASNEIYGGMLLRKAIDCFCHVAVAPEFCAKIERQDKLFASSEFYSKMRWLKDVNDDIYDPTYTDMLRVAFTSRFKRGKLQDLVALLSGRNFETKQYEEAIAEDSFIRLKQGVLDFINEWNFDQIRMILASAGFVSSALIGSRNAVNFAYIIYLWGKSEGIKGHTLQRLVRRWYVMSILRGRYSGQPETAFDFDVRQFEIRGLEAYTEAVIASELSESYWSTLLPQQMDTSSPSSPYFLVYQASQVMLDDPGFLSSHTKVRSLVEIRCDAHHIFPRNFLKKKGFTRTSYNQIANFALTESTINIAIGDAPPEDYFKKLIDQCNGSKERYGGITDEAIMRANLRAHGIPESLLDGAVPAYEDFLEQRRHLMAAKIKSYFASL